MNGRLHIILIMSSIFFLFYIFIMVRNRKLDLKYTLVWILMGTSFIMLSVFPNILKVFSNLLDIKEPVNTLFLSVIFFMLLIIFTLTIALSRNANKVKTLTQEIGILKLEMKRLDRNDGD